MSQVKNNNNTQELTKHQSSTRIILNQDLLVIYQINEQHIDVALSEIVKIEREIGYDVLAIISTSQVSIEKRLRENQINFLNLDSNDHLKIKKAFNYALNKGYKFTVSLDSDHQYNIREIEKLHQKALRGYDLVIGSRIGNPSFKLTYSNSSIAKALTMFAGAKIEDPLCFFRLFNWNLMNIYVNNYDQIAVEPYSYAILKRNEKIKIANQPVAIRKNNISYVDQIVNKFKYGTNQVYKIMFKIKK